MAYPKPLQKAHNYAVMMICKILSQLDALGFTETKAAKMLRLYLGDRLNVFMQPSGIYHYTDFNKIAVQLKYKSPTQMIQDVRKSKLFLIVDGETSYNCLFFASPLYVDVDAISKKILEKTFSLKDPICPELYTDEAIMENVILPGHLNSLRHDAHTTQEDLLREENEYWNKIFDFVRTYAYQNGTGAPFCYIRDLVSTPTNDPQIFTIFSRMDAELAETIAYTFLFNDIVEHLRKSKNKLFLRQTPEQNLQWVLNIVKGRYGIPKLVKCINRMIQNKQISSHYLYKPS